jgi:hypothetical protein
MQSQPIVVPETCFERTRPGQCEMLTQRASLNPLDRRLLAIINGFTPLGDLLALLGETEVPQDSVTRLLNAGFMRVVPATPRKLKVSGLDIRAGNVEWFGAR